MTATENATAARPTDSAGFPIGTRWIQAVGLDAAGNRLGHATADCLNYPTTAHANSACVAGLVQTFGDRLASHRLTWGD